MPVGLLLRWRILQELHLGMRWLELQRFSALQCRLYLCQRCLPPLWTGNLREAFSESTGVVSCKFEKTPSFYMRRWGFIKRWVPQLSEHLCIYFDRGSFTHLYHKQYLRIGEINEEHYHILDDAKYVFVWPESIFWIHVRILCRELKPTNVTTRAHESRWSQLKPVFS